MSRVLSVDLVSSNTCNSKAERPVITVVADNNIKKVLTSKKSTAWGCI
ncbi:hypothetical protein BV56_0945 [Limosilactobacillus mucosae]|nr:hypothetical protein BV56_0945 [Limosilactobacillus mucosae]SUQ20776.1 hypothetical protein SAMN02744693_0945 [Limosilactobacillus mucosae]